MEWIAHAQPNASHPSADLADATPPPPFSEDDLGVLTAWLADGAARIARVVEAAYPEAMQTFHDPLATGLLLAQR